MENILFQVTNGEIHMLCKLQTSSQRLVIPKSTVDYEAEEESKGD